MKYAFFNEAQQKIVDVWLAGESISAEFVHDLTAAGFDYESAKAFADMTQRTARIEKANKLRDLALAVRQTARSRRKAFNVLKNHKQNTPEFDTANRALFTATSMCANAELALIRYCINRKP